MKSAANLNHTILPETEIRELILRHRAGDEEAAARVIAHNERAIYRLACRYHATGVCGDAPLDDLMQWGRMGMLRALETFNMDSGNKFLSYAWHWVRMYVSRFGVEQGQQVTISYQANAKKSRIGRARETFMNEFSREPTPEELTEITGIPAIKIKRLRILVTSLDYQTDDKRSTVGEMMPSEEDFTEDVEVHQTAEQILNTMKYLPKRTQTILRMSYGFDGKEPASLKTIADTLGLTRERVRQIREEALVYLRTMS
jgi:RNA polymerase sigma factor (sigma-70 family)